ncbi:MAG: hypothetical protein ACK5PF_05570 [bacterium]|jgi:hypothetical protein
MRLFLLPQRELGRILPRVRQNLARPLEGEFALCDARDERLRRSTRLARFLSLAHPRQDLVPPLTDAQLLYAAADILIVNGSETIDDRDYLQTWMLATRSDALYPLDPAHRPAKRRVR